MSNHDKSNHTDNAIGKDTPQRPAGGHSLPGERSGESFQRKERARRVTVYQHQQGDVPQIHQPDRQEERRQQE